MCAGFKFGGNFSRLASEMEDLQAYIDNDQVVSVRWLANTLGSSVEKSRDLMTEYKKKHAETPASYLISGERESNSFGFRIVLEDKLEEEKEEFQEGLICAHLQPSERQCRESQSIVGSPYCRS